MNSVQLRPFHLAIPVDDLSTARNFYGELLGCPEGRSSPEWVDFDFFGHQLVCHLDKRPVEGRTAVTNLVDGHGVPVPHFGLVLDLASWEAVRDRLQAAHIEFLMQPTVRFRGQVGEQATMFFQDPAGNNLEIKAFADLGQLFAR
ncbi:MAG TPA: VOC family protein [Xanthomonadales bacterium]|nr:VOC family protein [Xanthomonadales bacterium]